MSNSEHLRRLACGAVLACGVLWTGACAGNDDLSAPETPPAEPPPDVGIEPSAGCTDGMLEHGALYRICFPAAWNGDLVVYAHGYVAPSRELALPEDEIGGQPASSLATGLG